MLLNRPEVDHRYCVGWANESWSGIWHGEPNKVLVPQVYELDDRAHYRWLVQHFSDDRYLTIDRRPLLYVLNPDEILNQGSNWFDGLHDVCESHGIPRPYIVGEARGTWLYGHEAQNLDAYCWNPPPPVISDTIFEEFREIPEGLRPRRYQYGKGYCEWLRNKRPHAVLRGHQCVSTGFDNTPRSGGSGVVLLNATPERIQHEVYAAALDEAKHEHPILFIKSWNEWAEGSIIEPCRVFGTEIGKAISAGLRDAAIT